MTTMNQGNTNRLGTTSTDPLSQGNMLHRQTAPLSNATVTTTTANPAAATAGITPKFVPTLTEDDAVVQARLLKALADPTRLRILSLLSRHEGEVCVFEIVESFTLEQPTISHHLRILRDAGLVDCRKKGLWAYYYVRRDALSRAQGVIENLA